MDTHWPVRTHAYPTHHHRPRTTLWDYLFRLRLRMVTHTGTHRLTCAHTHPTTQPSAHPSNQTINQPTNQPTNHACICPPPPPPPIHAHTHTHARTHLPGQRHGEVISGDGFILCASRDYGRCERVSKYVTMFFCLCVCVCARVGVCACVGVFTCSNFMPAEIKVGASECFQGLCTHITTDKLRR